MSFPAAPPDLPEDSPWRRIMPPWLLSVLLHATLLVVLGLTLRSEVRGIGAETAGRTVGIVVKKFTEQGEVFEGEEDAVAEDAAAEPTPPQDAASAALPTAAEAADPSDALPQMPTIGPGDLLPGDLLPGGGVGAAGEMTQGAQQPRYAQGSKAGLSLYGGPVAEGSKFVFAFDRSDSMVGAPLASAKRELMRSISALGEVHQFQIIFFNHDFRIFDLSGGQKRIPFASSHAKELAARFVGGITADGGTNRYTALAQAIGMRPDVIFFLTDADDPMSAAELERLRRLNRGTASIHCIEFGFGPASGGPNFLTRLADQNAGSYVYVDTTRLQP